MRHRLLVLAALTGFLSPGSVLGQSVRVDPAIRISTAPTAYNVKSLDFDLWCQQTQGYSSERCGERRVDDISAFEHYREVVERYELDRLKRIQRDEDTLSHFMGDPFRTVQNKQDQLP
jgi:hypothetical protein